MTPRPAATRHDATAMRFLDAGAQLIDAMLDPDADPPRLRHLHYPAALEWIRIEDVLRMVQAGRPGDQSKALRNRWPHRDDFLRDCLTHALLYRDGTGHPPLTVTVASEVTAPYASRLALIRPLATSVIEQLVTHPRSYLLAHAAPFVARDPELQELLGTSVRADQHGWVTRYAAAVASSGRRFRPGWGAEQLMATIQGMVDGMVVRTRLGIPLPSGEAWQAASMTADAVMALLAAVVDVEGDGLTVDDWLTSRFAGTGGFPEPAAPDPR